MGPLEWAARGRLLSYEWGQESERGFGIGVSGLTRSGTNKQGGI